MSKAFAFKQQCVKSDEELRKEQLTLMGNQVEDVMFIKNMQSTDETIPDEDEYTYQLVEEYEDEERIDEDDEDYNEAKNVQIVLKLERNEVVDDTHNDIEQQYNMEMNEESPSVSVDGQEANQEDMFEYEIENDTNDSSEEATKGNSDDELTVVPKMVFRKYNKRNKKLPTPPYACQVCSKVLSNYSSFKYHMQLHSDKKVY